MFWHWYKDLMVRKFRLQMRKMERKRGNKEWNKYARVPFLIPFVKWKHLAKNCWHFFVLRKREKNTKYLKEKKNREKITHKHSNRMLKWASKYITENIAHIFLNLNQWHDTHSIFSSVYNTYINTVARTLTQLKWKSN